MKVAPSSVIVGTYNEKNLFQVIVKIEKIGIKVGPGKDILKTMVNWPKEKFPKRSEVFPYPTNFPLECSRMANFFEFCAFILRNPGFACQTGSIEAFDDSLEDFYVETQIDLVVPVFGIQKDYATLYLKSRNACPEPFRLGVH